MAGVPIATSVGPAVSPSLQLLLDCVRGGVGWEGRGQDGQAHSYADTSSLLIFTTTPRRICYYCPHFPDKGVEVQKHGFLAQVHPRTNKSTYLQPYQLVLWASQLQATKTSPIFPAKKEGTKGLRLQKERKSEACDCKGQKAEQLRGSIIIMDNHQNE